MPRDYIFATMPPFPWYKYPQKKAIGMSFGEIYLDLYEQAARSGHAFTCRFTRSMLEPECTDGIDGWLPSKHLPSPTTLGDYMKLIGHQVPESSNALSTHVHITSIVQVKDFVCHSSPNLVIQTLESSMALFQQQWMESHRGGELSKHGNFPSPSWTLERMDAARCGWVPLDETWKVHVLESGDETIVRYGPGLEYGEDDLLQDLYDLDETEADARDDESGQSVPLLVQARKILDHLWCAEDPKQINTSQQADWQSFKTQMRASWSAPLLRTMLLLAAMVNCRVPLSAAAWINKLFVPVYVQYDEILMTIGLLAKHARQPEGKRGEPIFMVSVGQHMPQARTRGSSFGKDLFIVNPKTKVPVGLLPDFMPDERTDAQYVKITSVMYDGFCQVMGDNQVGIAACPLHAMRLKPAPNDD
ncbi:hypothetical protein BKA66DRAFT_469263 [Pyrenochaeta sp. MPI-SDFR-AT-0127]|nr:hypothetical protein BKA66DRAFT_469263 [Pyrenochaeta sp. MPI-SDFR-AT-0127]